MHFTEPARKRCFGDAQSLCDIPLRHPDSFDRIANLSRCQQVQVSAESVVDPGVHLLGEDSLAACLAYRKLKIGNRELVQTSVVANFGSVVHLCQGDFLFAAVTASPRKWPLGASWVFRRFCLLRGHVRLPLGLMNRLEPGSCSSFVPEAGISARGSPASPVYPPERWTAMTYEGGSPRSDDVKGSPWEQGGATC